MIDAVIYALISICVIVLVVYLVIWVLGQIGVPLPVSSMFRPCVKRAGGA